MAGARPMKTLCLLFLCWTTLAAADAGDEFARRCARLAAEARVEVRFEDGVLTRAEPAVTLVHTATVLAEANGRVCAVPAVTLTLGFAVLQVHLARELGDACRRAIVDAHEQEHVAVWRDHFRAGARLLQPRLQSQLGSAEVFNNATEARELLGQRVDGLVAPLLRGLREGIDAAQREIDSPGSYQAVTNRMRACPTAIGAGRTL